MGALYRCVLPAAHRQPGRSGQSQQGGTRVHRVQAVHRQSRSGGHVGSRGPHQQSQRYGEVVLSGKKLNPKNLLYVNFFCKILLFVMEMIVIVINPIKTPSTTVNATYSDNSFSHFRTGQIATGAFDGLSFSNVRQYYTVPAVTAIYSVRTDKPDKVFMPLYNHASFGESSISAGRRYIPSSLSCWRNKRR